MLAKVEWKDFLKHTNVNRTRYEAAAGLWPGRIDCATTIGVEFRAVKSPVAERSPLLLELLFSWTEGNPRHRLPRDKVHVAFNFCRVRVVPVD